MLPRLQEALAAARLVMCTRTLQGLGQANLAFAADNDLFKLTDTRIGGHEVFGPARTALFADHVRLFPDEDRSYSYWYGYCKYYGNGYTLYPNGCDLR